MAATGTLGKGTILAHSTTQGGAYTAVAKILGPIKPPATKVGASEVTCFEDPSEQFIPGWIGAGEGSFLKLYITGDTTVLYALVGTDLWWKITLPDTHTWVFEGFIDEYDPNVPLKEKIAEAIKIKVNGQPIYT